VQSARRLQPTPGTLALAGLGALLAFGYPYAVERALAIAGVRAVGAALVAAGLLSVALVRRLPALPALPGLGSPLRAAALLVLPALAAATARPVFLLLMPAALQALLAAVFALSLRGGGSLLRDAARWIHPYAPDFIGPYCRKVTGLFAAIFALQAVGVGLLALDPPESWALASSVGVWIPVTAASAVEWLFRKAWFRYYGPGPVDRLMRALLPPERTHQGRRSLEYVRRMRRELGMPPP
jgi:uncharacterized membrane protein